MSDTEVITGEAPSRYALALLELAEESKSLKKIEKDVKTLKACLLYTSPSPRDQRGSRMPSSA